MTDDTRHTAWNIVVVTADTLRTAYLGCYGNDWIHTPNLDRFASQSVRFTRAHPECLPPIPTRRTLHSGRRAYPFASYDPVAWDNVYIPGWQPLARDEATIAEALSAAGYHTGFVADVPHYFVPDMNFTRGFEQWRFVRGQSEDRLHSAAHADAALLGRYRGNEHRIRMHLENVRPQQPEEDWTTARTFRHAMRFVEDNAGRVEPFYLYVDSFTPHETWEAPEHYFRLYGDLDKREPICLTTPYAPVTEHPEYEERLPSIRAEYAGLVTLVDTWFGHLLDTIDRLGLAERTLVIFLSDHGTNFADNAEGVMGKPATYMYPGTMSIPMLLRHPDGAGAGSTRDEFVSTTDAPATVMAATGAEPQGRLDGQSLLPLAGGGSFTAPDYVTCRYANSLWYRDDRTWCFGDIGGAADDLRLLEPRVFDLASDPGCERNIADDGDDRIALACERLAADAGGPIPVYRREGGTDAIGRPVFARR
jgi:arylsulfatase A-like enzyme